VGCRWTASSPYPADVILVDCDSIGAYRPGRPLFEDLSVTVSSGDRLGIVGLNGTGKSTLLRVLAGIAEPESGTVRRGRGVRVAMLDQEAALPDGTALAAVGDSWEAEAVLDRLGMGAFADRPVAEMSGGQRKRVALARALVAECDLLILDEPTNHLDIDGIAWLEDRLAGFGGGLVLVTHDRHLLDRATTRILELDRGRGHVHEGGYASYLEAKAEREERAATAESVRRNLARSELAWLRRGAPARTRKPKARIEAATAIVEGKAQAAARSGELDLHFGTPRLGDKVVELSGVGHRFGDDPWLFRGVDLALDRRERLGIVGVNGTGKSTLLDIIAGRIDPREGHVDRGTTVSLGYYDQLTRELDPTARAREVVAGPHRDPDWTDARLLETFWFDTDTQWAPVELLSGGERRRLQLLTVLAAKPNVLLLDEPTNDLDVDTLRVLEDFLDEWPGALVVVSHDRAFLERTVTDVVVLDGAGRAGRRPGGYAAWEEERRAARSATKASSTPPAGGGAAPRRQGGARKDKAGGGRSRSTVRRELGAAERELERLEVRHDEVSA
jgi:ABC transport system ATP-binding/permease protein